MAAPPPLQRQLLQHVLRASGANSVDQLLFDPVTELPGLGVLARDVEHALETRDRVGILVVSIAQFSRLEAVYGWEVFDEIVRGVAHRLRDIKLESLRREDALAELTVNGNVFILMVSPPRARRALRSVDLRRIRDRVAQKLDAYLAEVLHADLRYRVNYFIGSGILKRDPTIRLQRSLFRTIDEALDAATSDQDRLARRRARSLREILNERRITTAYQPIVDVRGRRVIGYEALSRGPDGEFGAPDALFRVAYEADLVVKLDAACREQAVREIGRLEADQLLFVNMEPQSIFDPSLPASIPKGRSGQVVFEITEHAAIADFTTFRQAVQLVRQAGFQFAMDDVGSAYSGLRVIAGIEPNFIKLDMELTRDAHNQRVKMELVRAIASFCAETGVPLIAEGIETADELHAVLGLGIGLVQGYLLGRPVAAPGQEALWWPEAPSSSLTV